MALEDSVSVQGKMGITTLSSGGSGFIRLDSTGATVTSDGHSRFYETIARGNCYYLATGAAAPTAFTGGAGGTPLLAVYNPTGSGKNLAIISASLGVTAVPTAAGVVNPEVWLGVSVIPTGTVTQPRNMLSQQATGSSAIGFVNAATTGSTALNFAGALSSFWWATAAAGAVTSNGLVDLGGMYAVAPGNLFALGVRTVPLSLTASVSLVWEEIGV